MHLEVNSEKLQCISARMQKYHVICNLTVRCFSPVGHMIRVDCLSLAHNVFPEIISKGTCKSLSDRLILKPWE